jgi:hypothetical protein
LLALAVLGVVGLATFASVASSSTLLRNRSKDATASKLAPGR